MAVVYEPIRIDDLRNPVLTDVQREALEEAECHPVELSEDAVLKAARQATGLTDFGPDDFRDRLQQSLVRASDNTNITAFGRASIFHQCVRSAITRLRLENLLSRHPEIHDVSIREPIIIAGPPRSATTHLHGLLGADSRLRSLPLWESAEPIPPPNHTIAPNGVDPRLERYVDMQERQALLPHTVAMFESDPYGVAEETFLMKADFPSGSWTSQYEYMDIESQVHGHRNTSTWISHYKYMKTMLKALQWQRGPDRWVLKSPLHSLQLSPLLATFPDATIVMTHRDPVAEIQSGAMASAYISRLYYRQVDIDAVFSRWVKLIEGMLHASMRDRHLIPEGRLVDVLFHQFMNEKLRTVERIYATADLELTDKQRERMATFLSEHRRGKNRRICYDLRCHFGIDPAALRTGFDFYVRSFPIEIEVQ